MSGVIKTAGEQLEHSLEAVLTKSEQWRLTLRIGSALLAGMFLLVGKLSQWLFPTQEGVAGIILLLGAVIASFYIFQEAVKGFFAFQSAAIMEQLVGIALLAAFAKGDYETAILVPLLLSIAHFFEERSILGARAAVEGLKTLQAREACLLIPEGERIVPAEELRVGDRILVRPGEMFPVDGEILHGKSAVDQSSMTGEMIPVDVIEGDKVFAGTINMQGQLHLEVQKEVGETSLSKIVEHLRQAEASRTPTMRLIEQYTAYYLPFVILVAIAVLFMTKDLNRVIAVLVVSCPCAQILVSSTPMVAALAVSTRNGVLIKNSSFLEVLGDIKTIIFDKTGTLTEGHLDVVQLLPVSGISEEELLNAALMAAQGSTHPVSRAIVRTHSVQGLPEVAAVEEAAGLGVVAKGSKGEVFLGRRNWLESQGFRLPQESEHYGPVVWVARNKQVLGQILLADSLRPEALEMVQEVRNLGIQRTVMLTGDRRQVANVIRAELSLDEVYAECLPADKLKMVEREKSGNVKLMVVGDGVNDALALATADIGVAMGAMGSDIAVQSADVALMGNDLRRLPFTIRLARKTKGIIYQNMVIAALSSLLMLFLAGIGAISPLVGALLHNIGAFFVLFNSARLLRFDQKK